MCHKEVEVSRILSGMSTRFRSVRALVWRAGVDETVFDDRIWWFYPRPVLLVVMRSLNLTEAHLHIISTGYWMDATVRTRKDGKGIVMAYHPAHVGDVVRDFRRAETPMSMLVYASRPGVGLRVCSVVRAENGEFQLPYGVSGVYRSMLQLFEREYGRKSSRNKFNDTSMFQEDEVKPRVSKFLQEHYPDAAELYARCVKSDS